MKTWLLPVALAALLALAGAVVIGGLLSPPPGGAAEAQRLATELRCPDCAGLSVAESTSASASAIRAEIDAQLASGATPDAVRQHFVDRYGQWILLSPTAPVAWLLPLLVVLAGAAGLVAWLRRRGDTVTPAAAVSPADVQRVRDEAEALDA